MHQIQRCTRKAREPVITQCNPDRVICEADLGTSKTSMREKRSAGNVCGRARKRADSRVSPEMAAAARLFDLNFHGAVLNEPLASRLRARACPRANRQCDAPAGRSCLFSATAENSDGGRSASLFQKANATAAGADRPRARSRDRNADSRKARSRRLRPPSTYGQLKLLLITAVRRGRGLL